MSNANHILSRALQDRFYQLSNTFNLAQDFCGTLEKMTYAANKAFERVDPSVASAGHYIMDLREAAPGSALCPDGDKTMVVYLNVHDTCKPHLRHLYLTLPEPGLILTFHEDGRAVAVATKNGLPDQLAEKIQVSRCETYRVTDQNGLEGFVASWLRNNFDSKIMVEMQNQLSRADKKRAEELSAWVKPPSATPLIALKA